MPPRRVHGRADRTASRTEPSIETTWNVEGHGQLLLAIVIFLISLGLVAILTGLIVILAPPDVLVFALVIGGVIGIVATALPLAARWLGVRLESNPAGPGSRQPSAALLVYLFADRVVPFRRTLVTLGRTRVPYAQVPCRDGRVDVVELSATLLTASFFGLRQRGLIRLQLYPDHKVTVACVKRGGSAGLEAEIMEVLGGAGGESTVSDIVVSLLHRDPILRRGSATERVVTAVMQEAVDRGYIRIGNAHRGAFARWAWGARKAVANCPVIQGQRRAFDQFLEAWQSFQQSEPELYAELMGQSKDIVAWAERTQRTRYS